jgi:hypothetical protein
MPRPRKILGISFLGTSGDEAIHCVLDAMYCEGGLHAAQACDAYASAIDRALVGRMTRKGE